MVFPCKFDKPDSKLEYWEQRQYIYAALMLYVQEKYMLSYAEARIFLSSIREEYMGGYLEPLGISYKLSEAISERLEKEVPWDVKWNPFDHNYMDFNWERRDPRVF